MEKFAKNFLKVLAVMAIFAVLFSANLYRTTGDIQDAKKSFDVSKEESSCTNWMTTKLGCIEEEFGIASYYTWFTIPVFIFFVFFIVIKKGDKILWKWTPLLILFFMTLTEITIAIFRIPVIHIDITMKDAYITMKPTVFLGWEPNSYVFFAFFALFFSYPTAVFGYLFANEIKEALQNMRNKKEEYEME